MTKNTRPQTPREELFNSLTHGIGLLFFIAAIPFFIAQNVRDPQNRVAWWAALLFIFGLLAVYFNSTLYHFVKNKKIKEIFQKLDHISIFLLIGGTYTPVVSSYAGLQIALPFLLVLWWLILGGILLKILVPAGKYKWLSVCIYILLGWLVIFIAKPLFSAIPLNVFYLLLAGGAAYTIGTIFYILKKIKYTHSIWHLFVLTGSIMHFFAICQINNFN